MPSHTCPLAGPLFVTRTDRFSVAVASSHPAGAVAVRTPATAVVSAFGPAVAGMFSVPPDHRAVYGPARSLLPHPAGAPASAAVESTRSASTPVVELAGTSHTSTLVAFRHGSPGDSSDAQTLTRSARPPSTQSTTSAPPPVPGTQVTVASSGTGSPVSASV